jgi:hypothetical protein
MEGKRLYPDYAYFELAKELPSAPVGTTVTIIDADGRECLVVHGELFIELNINMANEYPEWFIPVTHEEHANKCKQNTIDFYMSRGMSKDQAMSAFDNM